MKKHNFNPGPSILPPFTVEHTAKAILDLDGIGLSLLEISHRSKEFQAIIDEAVALMKELLRIPDGYSVIFLGGGASLQFAMVPFNFLRKKAAYLVTGEWAKKAMKEAKMIGETMVVASSEDKLFSYLPKNYVIPSDADYFHFTSNNTIYGTEMRHDPDCPVPLVCDMSSNILSHPIDVSKYALIYGGAQKNLGPAGVTFVIIRDEFLNKTAERIIPTMLSYKTHVEKGSLFNTPPCVNIYSCLMTLRWIKANGGMEGIEKNNIAKASLLYDEIDRNKLFRGTVAIEDRSRMNVCWVMKDEYKELEPDFQAFASSRGMIGIKGHRSVGGFRASLYNAMPLDSVKDLVAVMQEFEAEH